MHTANYIISLTEGKKWKYFTYYSNNGGKYIQNHPSDVNLKFCQFENKKKIQNLLPEDFRVIKFVFLIMKSKNIGFLDNFPISYFVVRC